MNTEGIRFLSSRKPFSFLPKEELERLMDHITEASYPEGTIVSAQGKSRTEKILVVRKGKLELFYEIQGKKILSGFLKQGEVCGGIAALMNSGVAVRTVMAVEETAVYAIPAPEFLDLAQRYPKFQEFFVNIYSKFMLDESYATIMAAGQAPSFLKAIAPFSFLPEPEIEKIAARIAVAHYPKEKVIYVQGQSAIDYLHIIYKGSAERYYEEGGKRKLVELIEEGGIYGGISILLNKGVSVRSLMTCEKTYCYLLPKPVFIDICNQYKAFTEYFTDTFSERMLDRSYAEIISKTAEKRDDAIRFFNQPIATIYKSNLICCDVSTTIRQAAAVMTENRISSIFARDGRGKIVGIITDHDFRKKVISAGFDIERPVAEIMTSPVESISAQAMIIEGLMAMMRKNVKHLAVTDSENDIVGIVTNRNMLLVHGRSPLFILTEISIAKQPEALMDKQHQLPGMVKNLIAGGAKANNVTRLITTVTDAILEKLIKFAIERIGPPPVRFVFMIMGSEGRKEQTLKTDQDNAILYEDVAPEQEASVQAYFAKLGEMVCDWLNQAGYAYCQGDIMAKNPKWRLPLTAWKVQFNSWVRSGDAEDLLQSSIFFDFRGAFGDMSLIQELRGFLFKALVGWLGFFRHLSENALHFKPPLGFFRNFVVESKGEHKDAFDIKKAMMPLVDFARIYALHHQIEETNTLERLRQLHIQRLLSWKDYNDLEQSYSYLMQLRFSRQVSAILDDETEANNYINPQQLSRLEQTMLKEIFKRIERFQTKLNFDFIGIA